MTIPEQNIQILNNLLGGLINNDESKIAYMGSDLITSEMLPRELKFHIAVLQGLERCDEKALLPTVDNVTLLSLSKDPEMAQKVQKLSELKSSGMIHANAIWVKAWLQQDLLTKAVAEIEKLSKVDYGNAMEKQGMMLDTLLEVPLDITHQSYNRLELVELLEVEQRRRVDRKSKGQALGPIYFLEGLRDVAPILAEGDITLLTAPPKAGKTTVGMIMAEQNAYDNDTDVLWLLLETGPKTIEERFLARELLIPGKRLRDGSVDLSKPPFLKAHTAYKEQQREHWNNDGHIHIEYVAGEKLSTIRAKIRVHKRMADTRNRPLLVIIDYLQRIPKPGSKTDVEAIALIANQIKDFATTYGCHILLFSQESFSQDGKSRGDSRAHGSNTPIFVAQYHVGMRVLNAITTVLISDQQGRALKDACGGDRYWQLEGISHRQTVVRFDLLRANDGDTTQAYAAMEGGLFQLVDLSLPNLPVPEFMKDQMSHFSQDMQSSVRQLL